MKYKGKHEWLDHKPAQAEQINTAHIKKEYNYSDKEQAISFIILLSPTEQIIDVSIKIRKLLSVLNQVQMP